MLLNDRERAEAVADVARLILSSGQTARVLRVVPGERLYGTDDAEYAEISVIPLELNETPPEELILYEKSDYHNYFYGDGHSFGGIILLPGE